MITRNPMQLKAFIKKKAVEKNISAQLVMQNYMLERTADKRGSRKVLEIYPDIIAEIRTSEQLRGFWKKYQRDFDYAKAISFDDACDTIQRIMDTITM